MLVGHLKTLGRQAAIYGSADVLGTLINFALLPVITRYLSPSDYGALGILLLFGVMTKVLFRLGLDSGFFRIYYEQQTEAERRTFTTTIFVTAGAVSLAGFAVVVAAAGWMGTLLLGDGRAYVVLVAADTFVNTFAFVPMNLFRIQGRAGYFTGASVFRNALNAALKVILVVTGFGIAGVLWSDVISSAVFLAALSPTVFRSLGLGFSWIMLREAVSFGLPKVPHSVAYQVLNLADRKLLDLFSTRDEVGLYHLGCMFGTGVKFFLSAFELAWSPFVYSLLQRADAPETLARVATYAAVSVLALGLTTAVLGREILALMTAPEFHSAHTVIPVIALAYVLQGLSLVTSIGIGIRKKSYYYPVMTFLAAALNVGLNLLLIPHFGKMGAAWSTVAGYGLMAGLGIYFSNRVYPIPFEWGRMGRAGLAAGICYGLSLVAPKEMASAILFKMLALAVFPAALYLLGFFPSGEIASLRRVVAVGSRETALKSRDES